MHLIFCSSPLVPSLPDELFQREASAAARLGIEFSLVDFEALVNLNDADKAVRKVRQTANADELAIYRGLAGGIHAVSACLMRRKTLMNSSVVLLPMVCVACGVMAGLLLWRTDSRKRFILFVSFGLICGNLNRYLIGFDASTPFALSAVALLGEMMLVFGVCFGTDMVRRRCSNWREICLQGGLFE